MTAQPWGFDPQKKWLFALRVACGDFSHGSNRTRPFEALFVRPKI